jgi:hypothetical protein
VHRRPEERKGDTEADDQYEVESHPRRQLADILADPVEATEHRARRAPREAGDDP